MLNWDKNVVKCAVDKSVANGKIVLFPLQLCLEAGWDKYDYDNYQVKYCAGALVGEQKETYEILYLGIQRILGLLECQALMLDGNGKTLMNPYAVKTTIELWNKVSYQQTKTTMVEQIDKAKRLKEQREADETSPIKI